MRVNFYEDPQEAPKSRADVRINKVGIYVYPDRRRVAIGFDITPFLERPSLAVDVLNQDGQIAASLSIIELLESNFTMTVHLRDEAPSGPYEAHVVAYYASPDEEMKRLVVDEFVKRFDVTEPGEQ